MKRGVVCFIVMLAVAAALFAAGAPEERSLDLAHVFATDHPVHRGALYAKELLEERTDGALTLRIYSDASYAGYDDAVRSVRAGDLDLAPIDTAMDYYPESGVLLAPYVFQDFDHWMAFKNSEVAKELKADISEIMGVRYLEFYQFGFRQATANVRAETPDDWEDLRLRVVDFAPYPEIATVLNARPIATPIEEVYMALQTGVADAQENPFSQILTMHFYEVQDYLILTDHLLATTGIAMAQSTWDSLSSEEQEIAEEVFTAMANRIDEIVIEEYEEMFQQLTEVHGMTPVEVDTTPFRDRVGLVLDKYPEWESLYFQIQELY